MKKLQPFLLVGATCIILLGGLWATGLLHFPKAEKQPTPDSPKQAEKQTEHKKPHELIVGKWEGDEDGVPIGAEFSDKGLMIFLGRFAGGNGTEKRIGGPIKFGGSYKFLDDKTLETELAFGKAVQTQYQVEMTEAKLKLTSEKKTLAFKRVQEFSAALTKEESKTNDKEAPPSKPSTAKAVLTFKKHEASVEAVAISPDGTLVASGGDDGIVLIWERATGRVRHKLNTLGNPRKVIGSDSVHSVAFSPDGSTVASGSVEGVILWNVETAERRRGDFGGRRVAFSPDGKTLVTATYEEVHVWDLVDDKKVFSKKTPGSITRIAISPDGKLIASGDLASYVRVWDATTGEQKFSYKNSRGQIHAVDFSQDSTLVAANSAGVFDLKTGEKVALKGQLATDSLPRPHFLPDGKHIACEHWDDSVRICDLSTGQERLILKGHTGPIKALAVSPDGKWLASASQDHTVKVWDVSSVADAPLKLARPQFDKDLFKKRDAIMQVAALDLSTFGYSCLAISPNEKYAFARYGNVAGPSIRLWSINDKRLITESNNTNNTSSTIVSFSPDSLLYASCETDKVRVWSLPDRKEHVAFPNPALDPEKNGARIEFRYSSVVFSSDGKKVAACGRYSGPSGLSPTGGVVTVWDTTKGNILTTLSDSKATLGFTGVAFSPDSEKVAYSTDREVKIWSLSSNSQQHAVKTSVYISRLSWSNNGSLLAIVGSGKTLLWDVTNNRGTYLVGDAAFLHGNDFLVSVDSKSAHVREGVQGLSIFKLYEGGNVSSVSSTDDGNRMAVIAGDQVTMWKINKEALELVRQERLSKSPNAKAKVFENKDGFEIPQGGFWIDKADSTSLIGLERRLVIAIHRGTSFNQPIKVKVSSEDKKLGFSPDVHEIKKGDTKTKEVVFLVRDLGETDRYCPITVATDPPSNIVTVGFMARKNVSAVQLLREYKDNEAEANNAYKGKLIQVTGTIKRITEKWVELKGADPLQVPSVDCYFKDRNTLFSLSEGKEITITGVCEGKGFFGIINIKACELAK